jgi:hypothetical protein
VAFSNCNLTAAWAEVVVLAGSAEGRVGKEPDATKVNEPFAVAFDAEGRIYGVEYTRGNRLFRIAKPSLVKDKPEPPGSKPQVEFVAGVFYVPKPKQSFPPDAATAAGEVQFHGLHDVAIGYDGTVFVADTFNHRIRGFDPMTGTVRVLAGTGVSGFAGDGGPGRDALLAGPKYVAFDRNGRVLIADTENHCIRRYDPASGTIELVAGMPPRGGATVGKDLLSTQLMRPHGCCLDPEGRLVIADSDNDRIIVGDLRDER